MPIEICDLSLSYRERPVLHRIFLKIPEGRFSVLLGPNGSGKSTLLKAMAGQLPSPAGAVRLFGRNLSEVPVRERARLVGYLPQSHHPVFPFTVEEIVLTGRASYVFSQPGQADRRKAEEAMETAGLTDLRRRPYTELSGGERQLVLLARLLAQDSPVLLLDEPVSHLDLANTARLLAMVRRLTQAGRTVLAVLHEPNSAFLYGNHFFFLKNGTLQQPPHPDRPWDGGFISGLYGVPLEVVPFQGKAFLTPGLF